jgi:hypothetical protein
LGIVPLSRKTLQKYAFFECCKKIGEFFSEFFRLTLGIELKELTINNY